MPGARNPIDALRHWLAARRFNNAFGGFNKAVQAAEDRRCTQDIHRARLARRRALHEALAWGKAQQGRAA